MIETPRIEQFAARPVALLPVACTREEIQQAMGRSVRALMDALAAQGEAGVANLLDLIAKEMRVAMTLTGTRRIADIGRDSLVSLP